ncbi:MAG: hypothetical protein LBP21_10695 [Synergistaceae bacterium]|jgi:hypothetical protein|nr:hypothetical protein [Synergistaceae bacterium]
MIRRLPVVLTVWLVFFATLSDAAPNPFVVAESEGVGLTRGEALMNARRNGVEQAIGVLSAGVSQTIDGRVRENVLQLSRGFIEKYEIQKEQKDGARWRVKIKAWIRRENLLAGLLQKDPDKSVLDGSALFTRAMSREQQVAEAAEMLIETFDSIPYENYVHVAVGAEGFDTSQGSLTMDVRFSFDRERYFSQLVPLLTSTLDYIAESRQRDIPFLLELEPGDPVVVTPPSGINTLSQYVDLMEMADANRYIDLPGGGGFANIYLLTQDYYFDSYRVPPQAFALLTESLLRAEKQGRLSGRVFEGADLKIAFKNKGGQLIYEHTQPLQLYNVTLFAGLVGLKRSPYVKGKPDQLDERHHALFILPCLGTLQGNAADYLLIESETASISVKLSPQDIKRIERVDCRIELKKM